MTETINSLIFDSQLCRDGEDIMILSDLEQQEEQRLSQPISGNMSCLNLIVTVCVMAAYGIISLLL